MHKSLEIAVSRIKEAIPDLIAIVLFGTFGSEYETANSDIDLAFLADKKQDPVNTWKLVEQIASAIQRDVDLIYLREASTVFRYQVLTTGQLIYCADPFKFGDFDTTSFSMYFHLQDMRKEILDDYKRGNIKYG